MWLAVYTLSVAFHSMLRQICTMHVMHSSSRVALGGLGALPPPVSLTSVALHPSTSTSLVLATGAIPSATPLPSSTHFVPPVSSSLVPPSALTWSVPTPTQEQADAGLILSPAGEVLPRKLVDKIRSKTFVEMKEMLADNISLLAQLETLQGPTSIQVVGAARPHLREVVSLPTWCFCFQ